MKKIFFLKNIFKLWRVPNSSPKNLGPKGTFFPSCQILFLPKNLGGQILFLAQRIWSLPKFKNIFFLKKKYFFHWVGKEFGSCILTEGAYQILFRPADKNFFVRRSGGASNSLSVKLFERQILWASEGQSVKFFERRSGGGSVPPPDKFFSYPMKKKICFF